MTVASLIRSPATGGGGALSATASPSPGEWEFIGDEMGSAYQFICVLLAAPTGGLAPYTYAWAALTGDAVVLPNGNSVGAFFGNSGANATVKCTVTDANGAVAVTNTITITL